MRIYSWRHLSIGCNEKSSVNDNYERFTPSVTQLYFRRMPACNLKNFFNSWIYLFGSETSSYNFGCRWRCVKVFRLSNTTGHSKTSFVLLYLSLNGTHELQKLDEAK